MLRLKKNYETKIPRGKVILFNLYYLRQQLPWFIHTHTHTQFRETNNQNINILNRNLCYLQEKNPFKWKNQAMNTEKSQAHCLQYNVKKIMSTKLKHNLNLEKIQ